jgi:hypothetical protein
VTDYWAILSGLLLLTLGAYNVWLSRSPRYEDNPFTAWISRWLGASRARTLTLVAGIICLLLGVYGVVSAVTGI